jgi:hypothetical protein
MNFFGCTTTSEDPKRQLANFITEVLDKYCVYNVDKEAYLLVVDWDGTAKACTEKTYPLPIALQMAWAFHLPVYTGRGGMLLAKMQEDATRKAQGLAQMPDL